MIAYQHHIPRLEVKAQSDQIDRESGVVSKDNFIAGAGIDEFLYFTAGALDTRPLISFDPCSDLLGKMVPAPPSSASCIFIIIFRYG
jgi:hypothetical protein